MILLSLLLGYFYFYFTRSNSSNTTNNNSSIVTDSSSIESSQSVSETPKEFPEYTQTSLSSRNIILYAEDLVRAQKPTPPEAARFYAYVSSVYSDVFEISNSNEKALVATGEIINQIYPSNKQKTNDVINYLIKDTEVALNEAEISIVEQYKNNEKNDPFHSLKWDGVIPEGNGKWVKTNLNPFAPTAGQWNRWIVTKDTDYNVPEPIRVNSPEYEIEKQKILEIAQSRTSQQIDQVNFWGGTPGSESPSGIWQNVMFEQLKDKNLDNLSYAKSQKILSQSIADAFLETWKIKYQYWTERPSMTIEGLKLSMPDPIFPGYVSGHTTISYTAANVLGALYPEKKQVFLDLAMQARQSRLYAGVHFDFDNRAGAKLGEAVSTDIIQKLNLQPQTGIIQPFAAGYLKSDSLEHSYDYLDPLKKDRTGHLYMASVNSDYNSKRFLLAVSDESKLKSNDGFSLTKVGSDPFWEPGACASLPSLSIGGRYLAVGATFNYLKENQSDLTIYDLNSQQFKHINTADEIYFQNTFVQESDNSFSVIVFPKDTIENINVNLDFGQGVATRILLKQPYMVKRVINLPNLSYNDYKIDIPPDFATVGGDTPMLTLSSNNKIYGSDFKSRKVYILQQDNTFKSMDYVSYPEDNPELTNGKEDYYIEYNYNLTDDKVGKIIYESKGNEFLNLNLSEYTQGHIDSWDEKYIYLTTQSTIAGSYTNLKYINKDTKEMKEVFINNLIPTKFGNEEFMAPEYSFFTIGTTQSQF